jgi:hypothetical protein
MEKAYNVAEADLAAARAALAGAEAERDAYRVALTTVATVELDALEPADHVREVTKKVGPARERRDDQWTPMNARKKTSAGVRPAARSATSRRKTNSANCSATIEARPKRLPKTRITEN